MFDRASSHAMFENLEQRRLLSSGPYSGNWGSPSADLVDELQTTRTPPLLVPIRRSTDPLPNIKRTYTGTFSDNTGLTASFTLVIRKEEVRDGGSYAALRGTLDVVTNQFGNLHADMTYGKIRASNLRVNITLTGTVPAFTFTINAKASTSGSQIKGEFNTTGAVTLAGTFLVKKFVPA
ncbi:hypothetical protein BH09PLA1_BH09PLA1_27480 [soil metagenome]